ncbi:MAG: AAA family ATPase [Sandaracinaceae bacterium]
MNEANEELRARVAALARAMSHGLVERESAARLVLLAALAGEHSLLLGPPGTAKSELAGRLGRCFQDGRTFQRLLTRFSVPEELFGPLSIKALEEDRYHRLTEGYMPSATVAFLDEVFKANSAILNSLLTLLNERQFDNGTERVATPLITVVAASNEVPEDAELEALHDRFLVRCHVTPVSAHGFRALLELETSELELPTEARLRHEELRRIRSAALEVTIPDAVRSVLGTLRTSLDRAGIAISDRRWIKIAWLLRVAAACDGRGAVSLADCGLVVHCAWNRPEQHERVERLCRTTLDDALIAEPKRLSDVTQELEDQLAKEVSQERQSVDAQGQLLFLDESGHPTTQPFLHAQKRRSNGDPLYLPPARLGRESSQSAFTYQELWELHFDTEPHGLTALDAWTQDARNHALEKTPRRPVLEPMTHDPEHIAARVAQCAQVHADASALVSAIAAQLAGEDDPSIWPRGELGEVWRDRMKTAHEELLLVVERAGAVVELAERLRASEP